MQLMNLKRQNDPIPFAMWFLSCKRYVRLQERSNSRVILQIGIWNPKENKPVQYMNFSIHEYEKLKQLLPDINDVIT